MREARELMDAAALDAAIDSLAEQIVSHKDFRGDRFGLLGIRRRGASLAHRLSDKVKNRCGTAPMLGELDITLYRDDLSQKADQPIVGVSNVPFELEGNRICLVDDVLFTGRTVRSALAALTDYGRPRSVWLAVLVDRGWRELPIHADFAAMTIETTLNQVVEVRVSEIDGDERVVLMETD